MNLICACKKSENYNPSSEALVPALWSTTPSQDKSKKKLVTSKLKIVHEALTQKLSQKSIKFMVV